MDTANVEESQSSPQAALARPNSFSLRFTRDKLGLCVYDALSRVITEVRLPSQRESAPASS